MDTNSIMLSFFFIDSLHHQIAFWYFAHRYLTGNGYSIYIDDLSYSLLHTHLLENLSQIGIFSCGFWLICLITHINFMDSFLWKYRAIRDDADFLWIVTSFIELHWLDTHQMIDIEHLRFVPCEDLNDSMVIYLVNPIV